MKQLVLLLVTTFLTAGLTQLQGQGTSTPTPPVVVHKDPRIDVLESKQSSINTATKKAASRTARGYRLLVINTNKRDEAIAAKTKVYQYYLNLSPTLSFRA